MARPIDIECPDCRVGPGERCVDGHAAASHFGTVPYHHSGRVDAAAAGDSKMRAALQEALGEWERWSQRRPADAKMSRLSPLERPRVLSRIAELRKEFGL